MKFDQFQLLMQRLCDNAADETFVSSAGCADIDPERLHPLVLAYIGDAFFNLYVRTRLLKYEQNKVRVLHSAGAKMVSATYQAKALRMLEEELTDEEKDVARRGRNAKSAVPKSATLADYRASTALEALMGFLFIQGNQARLYKIADEAFRVVAREMKNIAGGEKL